MTAASPATQALRRPTLGVAAICAVAFAVFLLLPAASNGRRTLYTTNYGSGNVSAFDINAATGTLSAIAGSPFSSGGKFPYGAAINPSGTRLYTANFPSSDVSGYDINSATGALSDIAGSPFATGNGPYGVAISPAGTRLYITNNNSHDVSGYDINSATGALTPIPGSPFATGGSNPAGVAINPAGTRLYIANYMSHDVSGFNINSTTGALSAVPGSPFATGGSNPEGVAINPSGARLYVTNRDTSSVSGFNIDAATGALSAVAGSPYSVGGSDPRGVAVNPAGTRLYMANDMSHDVSGFNINSTTGALSAVPGSPFAPGGIAPVNVAVNPAGTLLYVTNRDSGDVSGFNINSTTGALSAVAGSPFATGGSGLYSLIITPDQPPTASFTSQAADAGEATSFDASSSTDPDGSVATYTWDFGDGQQQIRGSATTTHTYSSPGTYNVTLTLTDNGGCSTTQIWAGTTAYCNGGISATTAQPTTITESLPPSTPSTPTTGGDTSSPQITSLKVSPSCQQLSSSSQRGKNRHVRRGKRNSAAIAVSYKLSEDATVTLSIRAKKESNGLDRRCAKLNRGRSGQAKVPGTYREVERIVQNEAAGSNSTALSSASTSRPASLSGVSLPSFYNFAIPAEDSRGYAARSNTQKFPAWNVRRRHSNRIKKAKQTGVAVVATTSRNEKSGANTVRLSSRQLSKKLGSGSYKVYISAIDASGNVSNTETAKFYLLH